MAKGDLFEQPGWTTGYDVQEAWRERLARPGALQEPLASMAEQNIEYWSEQGPAVTLDVGLPPTQDLQRSGIVGAEAPPGVEPPGLFPTPPPVRLDETTAPVSEPAPAPVEGRAPVAAPAPGSLPPWGHGWQPGGGVAPGLRAPPAWDSPAPPPASRIVRATQFDPEWGPPRDRYASGKLLWNAERYVYEVDPDNVPGLGSVERRYYNEYLNQQKKGVFVQAYQDPERAPGMWRYRWVRVKTPYPDSAQPYEVIGDLETHGFTGAMARGLDLQEAAARAQAEAFWASDLGKLKKGEETDEDLFTGSFEPIYGSPEPTFNTKAYAWIPQRDLPPGCPYPYPYMPVPQEDYATGRWLSADYTPSIPLPPPYDQIAWRCGVHGAPTEGKGKPLPRSVTSMDFYERRQALLEMTLDELKERTAALEEEYAHLFDEDGKLHVDPSTLPIDDWLDVDELIFAREQIEQQERRLQQMEKQIEGHLPGPGQIEPPEPQEEPGSLGEETLEDLKGLTKEEKLEYIAKRLSELWDERHRAKTADDAARIDQEREVLGQLRGRLVGEEDQGGYSWGPGVQEGESPNSGGMIAQPSPEPKGGAGGGRGSGKPEAILSGVRVRCELPQEGPEGATARSRMGPASLYGSVNLDCAAAVKSYLEYVNKGLAIVNSRLEVAPHPQDPRYMILIDKITKIRADPAEFPKDLRQVIEAFNNKGIGTTTAGVPKDTQDARATPTTITLVNRHHRYTASDTGKVTNAHITPAQEAASGNVKVNVDAISAWQEVMEASTADPASRPRNPFNPALQLMHEIIEHSEGQTSLAKWKYSGIGGKRSGRSRGLARPDPEGVGNKAAATLVDGIARARGLPTRMLDEEERQRSRGISPFKRLKHTPHGREMPSEFTSYHDLGKAGGGPHEFKVTLDYQGMPLTVPETRRMKR